MKMTEVEKKIFRIDSTRLKNWDYSNPWWYFVTINTKDHKHWFGKIEDGEMILNKFGKIADEFWQNIPEHYQSAELDRYIIMPNHIHGIVILNDVVEKGHPVGAGQVAPSLQRPTLSNVIGFFISGAKF